MKRFILILFLIYILLNIVNYFNQIQKNRLSIKEVNKSLVISIDENKQFNYDSFDLYIPNIDLYQSVTNDKSNNIWIDKIQKIDNKQMIIIPGHRLSSGVDKQSFYHLDKLVLGDFIVIYDNKNGVYEKYEIYRIKDSEIANAKDYLDTTYDKELLLYTCTPHLTYHRRLIIKARILKQGLSLSSKLGVY